MKKLYTISGCLALALCQSVNVAAQQQLPNGGFEEDWVECIPWTSSGNKKAKGTTPNGWCISNVIGLSGLGATQVGQDTIGYESSKGVFLKNTANAFMPTQIVPGYLTLGKTWSTSVLGEQNDGGTFGGVEFTDRPTGIEFMYKRSRGESKPDEKTTIVAYLWKGHWTQAKVPSDIAIGSPKTVDMVDRDRCVLGMDMSNSKGGEVTASEDAELIAVINVDITENTDDWTKFEAKFDYKSDATPEMINIIIASGDYFGGDAVVGDGNILFVDDVKLVYDNASEPAGEKYPGKLTIDMMGSSITDEPMDANVYFEYDSDTNCTLTLPDFILDLGNGPANLGDIVVPNVAVTVNDNVANYSGEVKGLSLMGGGIVADAAVTGTIDEYGNANLKIAVTWQGIPIDVAFVGAGLPGKGTISGTTAIETIGADSDASAEYYNLNGVRVAADNLTPGIYVVRKGNKVAKIIVR